MVPFVDELTLRARASAMPNPLQRRSIAQMYSDHEAMVRKSFLASGIVGSSSLVNGVLTALNWVKPASSHRWRSDRIENRSAPPKAERTAARCVTINKNSKKQAGA